MEGDQLLEVEEEFQRPPRRRDATERPVHLDSPYRDSEDTPLLRDDDSRRSSVDESASEWAGDVDWRHLPWWRRPSVFWLLGPYILTALAFGGIIVPKINLILSLICREYYADKSLKDPNFTFLPIVFGGDNPQCRTPEVQRRVTQFSLCGSLITGILSAIIAPKLGALSDRYGRKPLMVLTSAGMLSGEIITIFAANYPETFNVKWIFLGMAIDGLCGSFVASMALSHSYATDCTPPNRRNVVFGWFHGCMFTGIAIGPALAGKIIKETGSIVFMFYIALGCHVFYIVYLILIVPESLSMRLQHAGRARHEEAKATMSESADWITQIRRVNIFAPLKILYPTTPGTNKALRRNLVLLAAIDAIIFGVASGAGPIIIIYSNFKFAWTTWEQSIFMTVANTCRVACLMLVLPALTWIFRRGERGPMSGTDTFELGILRVAIAFDVLGYAMFAAADQSAVFMAAGALASFGGMGSPTLQGALTKHVRAGEIGQLLGAMGLLHSVGKIVGPIVFNGIYMATVASFPQMSFCILAVLFGGAWGLTWGIRPGVAMVDEEDKVRRREAGTVDGVEEQMGL
ncbi:MFS general substrate transporter [Trichodelitschia bisporula]|uniref:MFS general substrate transporter n=1 Tax=Trichodelitschia bisporula TaxID=703511 RepID=A0A6G1HXN3_9PEZI|nr:MFS general substrate transporter [Trichodelitschia bisporula]